MAKYSAPLKAQKKAKPAKATPEPATPGLRVEMMPADRLVPYARNPRHNEAAVSKLMGSLREFGWRQPIVVNESLTVIAGHTRLLAAQRLGMAEVPVHVARGLTATQVKAYRLADNRTGQEATWDEPLLALELSDLTLTGFDVSLTGFDMSEVNFSLDRTPAIDPATEWKGMPEFSNEDQRPFQSLTIHFKAEEDVKAFAKMIGQNITAKSLYVWYPEDEIELMKDRRYAAKS